MTEPRDRFDPQTGHPIEYPTEPADAYTSAATHAIAPPGTVHPDYDARKTQAPEPRDYLLDTPRSRAMTPAQRIAAKARARDNSLISIALPDADVTVRAMPKSMDKVLLDVSLTGILSPAAQRSFYEASKTLQAMSPDEQMRLGEDVEEIMLKLGIGGAQDFNAALSKTYPLACLVEPRCVPTDRDIFDPSTEISLEMLTHADRMTIVNACIVEQSARVTAVAPFPDQAQVA